MLPTVRNAVAKKKLRHQILIIMEDRFLQIQEDEKQHKASNVAILIIMEDRFLQIQAQADSLTYDVAILIIMEDRLLQM